jgi:hypothetical protein
MHHNICWYVRAQKVDHLLLTIVRRKYIFLTFLLRKMSTHHPGPSFWMIVLDQTCDVVQLHPHAMPPFMEPFFGDLYDDSNFICCHVPPKKITQAG